jgi:hypothetical protein
VTGLVAAIAGCGALVAAGAATAGTGGVLVLALMLFAERRLARHRSLSSIRHHQETARARR